MTTKAISDKERWRKYGQFRIESTILLYLKEKLDRDLSLVEKELLLFGHDRHVRSHAL
jgi:hypothetical protein